ncbi:MAG TPA: phage tail tip lysozyme [Streptosporangiaceae bacterium]
MAKRAGLAAPAVAVVGAIATLPHAHPFGSQHHPGRDATASEHLAFPGDAVHALRLGTQSASSSLAARQAAQQHRPGTHASSPAPAPSATPHRTRAAQPAPSPRPARHTSTKPASARLSCSGSSAYLPENYQAIVSFMIGHGYSKMAAAGMAGNMWQESKGNPESAGTGGGGLIGWTPLQPGMVTGNPAADLQTQLGDVLTYNQQWAQYIPALNAASTAAQAADVYMNYFERPGLPAAANREAAATAVATACHL